MKVQTEASNGGSTEKSTVKMARLLNGQTDTNHGISTENATVKMARLKNLQTEPNNGGSTMKNSPKKNTGNAQPDRLATGRSLRLMGSNTN
jgi:hypothetical protein